MKQALLKNSQDNSQHQQKNNKIYNMETTNKNKEIKNIKDFNLEDLKQFITTVQDSQQEAKSFKPERLQNLRDINLSRHYNSGLSS